jgi:hypothetical protein
MSSLIGYHPEQVPTNQMLGKLAFTDDVPLQTAMASVNNMAALRAFSGATSTQVYLQGYYAPGDGGQGVFTQSSTAVTDDGGMYIVANDGTHWIRSWDGTNVWAAWWGVTTSTADIGIYFQYYPQYSIVHFTQGSYTVLTYPTEAQFCDKLYRGFSTIWRCNTAIPNITTGVNAGMPGPAFVWSCAQSQNFGADNGGNNINDMWNAGLSPIEGIGIIGNGVSNGVGFQMGNSGTNVYFIRPKNFGVQNFAIGFYYARTMTNCFLTGLENVTLKGNGTNLWCDNTDLQNPNEPGGVNSGENFYFKSCYIGDAKTLGVYCQRLQMVTFDNCSFDYNTMHATFDNSVTKMKNCYIEGSPGSSGGDTTASWFEVFGVSSLAVDMTTNLYMLGGTSAYMNSYDFFNVSSQGFGNPNVRCDATFFSSPARFKPLSSSWTTPTFGRTWRCNGANITCILSESVNLFPDVRFSRPDLSWYPNSTNCSLVTTATQLYSGATTGIQLTPQSTTVGASFVTNSMRLDPAYDFYIQFLALTTGTTGACTVNVQFYTHDGFPLAQTTFNSGTYTATFTPTTAFAGYQFYTFPPPGTDYAVITINVAPYTATGQAGVVQIGTFYAWQ